jgi:hypothetical protein
MTQDKINAFKEVSKESYSEFIKNKNKSPKIDDKGLRDLQKNAEKGEPEKKSRKDMDFIDQDREKNEILDK